MFLPKLWLAGLLWFKYKPVSQALGRRFRIMTKPFRATGIPQITTSIDMQSCSIYQFSLINLNKILFPVFSPKSLWSIKHPPSMCKVKCFFIFIFSFVPFILPPWLDTKSKTLPFSLIFVFISVSNIHLYMIYTCLYNLSWLLLLCKLKKLWMSLHHATEFANILATIIAKQQQQIYNTFKIKF